MIRLLESAYDNNPLLENLLIDDLFGFVVGTQE
jgi:hypothetical protein